jgi:hypothetical protein
MPAPWRAAAQVECGEWREKMMGDRPVFIIDLMVYVSTMWELPEMPNEQRKRERGRV